MSSAPVTTSRPGPRKSLSGDSAKYDVSDDTFETGDDYYTRYPNSWAKIRSVTSIQY